MGEKATLIIQTGATYEDILLEKNGTPAQIKRVSITLNDEEIIVLDGALMKVLEVYKCMPESAGFYHISLADTTTSNISADIPCAMCFFCERNAGFFA